MPELIRATDEQIAAVRKRAKGGWPTSHDLDDVLGWWEAERAAATVSSETSDGFHTFAELYHYRMLYNALLFNEWADLDVADVHKSWKHSDAELCFGGGWFVVVASTVAGQITNHYEAKDWDRFSIPEREAAAEWDGHDAAEAARRMEHLLDIAAGKAHR